MMQRITRRRRGRARKPKGEPLLASQIEALRRAATRRGAWTSPRVMYSSALDALMARGYVRAIGVLPDGTMLYEATDAGRAAAGQR